MFPSLKERVSAVSPKLWQRLGIACAAVLLTIHVCWIGTHLWLVKNKQINPWKLGGYGMYTVPHLNPVTHVFTYDKRTNGWRELIGEKPLFDTYAFNAANDWHVFRCRPFNAETLTIFLERNSHLRYRPLLLVVTEIQFSRYPIKITREAIQKVEIGWSGETKFGFRGAVCGESYSGTTAFSPSK